MKKLTLFLAAAMLSSMSFAAEVVVKTLDTTGSLQGTNQAYTGNCDIVSDGLKWNFTGNSKINPWRIGGKDVANEDRAVYTKTAIAENISKIEVVHGTVDGTTVNSFKLLVAGNADFSDAVEYVGTYAASATATFTRPADATWANKYYKFVYNITITNTSKNKYIQFSGVKFYTEIADVTATAIALDKTTWEAEQYKSTKLTATLTPAEATTEVVWTSSNENVATVANGTVTAVGVGTATITATAGVGVEATCAVTVSAPTILTCADAAEKALSVSANNALYANGQYVVRGYVTEIAYAYSASSGNLSVWLADTKTSENTIEAYKAVPVSEVEQALKVGDYVEVVGDLTKFNTTPELAAGCSIKKLANPTTAVDNATLSTPSVKTIENGQLIIIRDGVKYNAMGIQL